MLMKIEGSLTNPELVSCRTDFCPMTLAMTPKEWNTRAPSDAEQRLREALEGLVEFADQVIEAFPITPLPAHRACLARARDLLQPKAEQELR
jgi:hypothetical protein